MTRLGLGASYRFILTVPGRKTGHLYSTPVDVIEAAGERWLVAGYGPAGWVRNARAAREVTLSRGGRSEKFGVDEADPQPPSRCSEPSSVRSKSRGCTSTRTRAHPTTRLVRNLSGTPCFA